MIGKILTEARRATVFIAYARTDVSLMETLRRYLIPLERAGLLDVVAQDEIGSEEKMPTSHLVTADIILLLVSPDFLNSDYCYYDEMREAILRHKIGRVEIIPVLLRPVYWQLTIFSHLPMVPENGQAITTRDDQEETFLEVVEAVRKAALRLQASRTREGVNIFEHQDDAYHFLIGMIQRYGAKEAVLLQYSCHTSLPVLRVLLRVGAKVTVFIQHEETAVAVGSKFQGNRIKATTRNLRSDLGDALVEADQLKVYKYHAPCSMSAIRIDDRILCMGWYTYEQKEPLAHKTDPKEYLDQEDDADDIIDLSGHDRAAVVVYKGTTEFQALDKTFSVLEKSYRKYAEVVPI